MNDLSTVDRIRGAPVERTPFAHAVVDGFLDPDLFAALRRCFPDVSTMQDVRTRRAAAGYSDRRLYVDAAALATVADPVSGSRPFERLLALIAAPGFAKAFVEIFGDTVRKQIARSGGGRIRLRPRADVIVDRTGFALQPHTDGSAKLATALVYMADPGDPPEHGTRVYRPKRPGMRCETGAAAYPFEEFDEVSVAPYRPNTAFLFARSPVSFHGVAPSASEIPRRLLQIIIMADAVATEARSPP